MKFALVLVCGLLASSLVHAKDCKEAAQGAAAQAESMRKGSLGMANPGEAKSEGKKDGIETFSVKVTSAAGQNFIYSVKVDAKCEVLEEPTLKHGKTSKSHSEESADEKDAA